MDWVFDSIKSARKAVADLRKCAKMGFVVLQNPDGSTFHVSPDCKLLACGLDYKKADEEA